ncbi:MAG: hypothetical protein M3143_08260 [Actinomycetota bacterium]|nr:hypothetical protein [Actinomycetota bacterium]
MLTALVGDWLGRPVEHDAWTVQGTGFAPTAVSTARSVGTPTAGRDWHAA